MWPCYVINLADNTRRLEASAAQLDAAGLPWHRVEGVNGWQLDPTEIAGVYDKKRNARDGKHALVAPEIGCYLSHIAAWTKIAHGEAHGGFIFEDDFAAKDTLADVVKHLSQPQEMWDMVKLFTYDPQPRAMFEATQGAFRVIIPDRVPTCLIGYGLTKSAAKKLVDNAIPFFRPVDEDQKFIWETGLRVAVALPAPITVGDQEAATGTIGAVRRATRSGRSSLGQALHNLRYQWRYRRALKKHWRRMAQEAE